MTDTLSPQEHLARTDLFAGLSKRQLKKVAERSETVQHRAGRKIAAEGLGALAFHLIVSGEAAVSKDGQQLRTLGAGDYFGEISIIDGKPRSVTVETVSEVTTLVVPYQVFQDLLDSDATFARALLTLLCRRLREAESR